MKKNAPSGSRRIAHRRGLTGVSLALVVLFSSLYSVVQPWSTTLNGLLGISSDEVTRSMDEADYLYLSDYETASDLIDAEIALNTRLAAEGAVLLKGTAAVEGTQEVTLFGMRSEAMQYGGTMGSLVSESQCVSLADALTANGFSVNPTMRSFYQELADQYAPGSLPSGNCVSENAGFSVNEVPVSEYGAAQESSFAEYRDAAIIVLGREATEGSDYYPGEDGQKTQAEAEAAGAAYRSEWTQSTTGNVLGLSDDERDLIAYVKEQGFEKIIVLLNSDNAMEIEELKADDAIHAILWIGTPGCYGTYGIAKLLSGEIQPSGHLTDTYAVNSAKAPAAVNYGAYTFTNADEIDTSANNALRAKWYLVENESIYTGYKYYETRYYDSMLEQGNAANAAHGESFDGSDVWNYDNEVSYSFGYGLEGSTFREEITDLQIDWSGEEDSTAAIEVTNTGSTAAKHVVQLYISVPYTDADRENGVEKAAIQLIGYAKTGESAENDFTQSILLAPGESETVTVTFNARDMMSYDKTLAHDGVYGGWTLSAGDYWFATGNGAHEAVNAVLAAQDAARFGSLAYTGCARRETLSADVQRTESNGTVIQNQLDAADIDSWCPEANAGSLSRSDWAATWPQEITNLTASDRMIALLRNEEVSAMLNETSYNGPAEFTYSADNGVVAAQLVGLAYDDPLYEQVIEEVSLEELAEIYIAKAGVLTDISLPKANGADSPCGIISSFGKLTVGSIFALDESDPAYGHETNVYVCESLVAAAFSHLLASEEGRLIGNDALWTNIHTWNGPGMNIHRTQYNGRNEEYYSEDAALNGYMAADVIRGAQSKGLVVGMKHFAFNDQETNRDGLAVFIGEQAARENELRGYEIAVRNVSVSCIMTAFNRVGCTHASASDGLCNGILRGEWGYEGRLITDSVKSAQYFRPTECLLTSHDTMLGGAANGKVWGYTAEDLADSAMVQSNLREAFHRYLYVMVNSSLMNGVTVETSVSNATPWWQTILYVGMGASGACLTVFAVLWILEEQKRKQAVHPEKEV